MMNILNRTIIMALFIISTAFAGNKKVLVEILTNSHCPLCPPAHSTLDNYLQTDNANSIEYIYYHMPFPYPTDELYKHNKSDSEAKNNFYGPHSSTPKAFFNGTLVGNSYSNWASNLNNLVTEESPVDISLGGSYTQNDFTITATVTQIANISASDLTINYVVVENLNYNGNNGINNHKNVMRKIVNPEGDSFSITLNETKNLQTTITTNGEWNKDNLKIIVFVQSKSQKSVLQSESILYSELTITSVEGETALINNFKLKKNYPNPFNPSTTIKYSIPSVATKNALSVQLIVYDILGNEINTLVDEHKQAGNYEVNFDASNLSNGVYYYQLKADNFIETKKMILLK